MRKRRNYNFFITLKMFITEMELWKLVPSEHHIDVFLRKYEPNKEIRENLIKFCFYNWEQRNDETLIKRLEEIHS
jgi:hypothetical protein